jgi:hypothetical protein
MGKREKRMMPRTESKEEKTGVASKKKKDG